METRLKNTSFQERRAAKDRGMLIPGAIIARGYGLPCATGVPDATPQMVTGDRLTVDGSLGIVTVSRND